MVTVAPDSAEKSGKSTLTGYLAAMVSTGGHFLDARCQMGNVLILGLEEFIGELLAGNRYHPNTPCLRRSRLWSF